MCSLSLGLSKRFSKLTSSLRIEFIFITVHITYHHISTAQQIGAMVSSITEESNSVDKTILPFQGEIRRLTNYRKLQLEEEIVTNANINTLFSIQGHPTNKFKPDTYNIVFRFSQIVPELLNGQLCKLTQFYLFGCFS